MNSVAFRADLVLAGAEKVPSPCISVCSMEPGLGLCSGCWRTLDEIAAWGGMDDVGKRAVWRLIAERAGRKTA